MSNYSPINQQLSYNSQQPVLFKNDIYNSKNIKNTYGSDTIDLSFESTQEYNQISNSSPNIASVVLRGMIEDNEISRMYFSKENIHRVQKRIKLAVYEKSKGQYTLEEEQDENDLIVTMRYIYLDNCKNLPREVIRQVKILNNMVVEYVLPDIMTNIRQYYGYIKNISTPITPQMRPMSTSSAGRRLLPSYTTLWK